MKFIEEIRIGLGITGAEFGRRLGLPEEQERQGYFSLLKAQDRIKLEILVALRNVSGLTDTQLLDAIEREVTKRKNSSSSKTRKTHR